MNAVCLIRICSLFLITVFAMLLAAVGSNQQSLPKQDDRSFLIQLGYTKLDLPALNLTTCMAVFPDGRFHMEKSWQTSTIEVSGSETFEASLSQTSLKTLLAILVADDFKILGRLDEPGAIAISQGQLIWAMVPRPEANQTFFLVGLEGSAKQNPRPLPQSVGPLITWIQAVTKNVRKEKLSPVKGAKSVNCWLHSPFTTFAKNLSRTPPRTGEAAMDGTKADGPGTKEPSRPVGTDDNTSFEPAKAFVDLSPAELVRAIPELQGFKPASDQEDLNNILEKLGNKTEDLFRKMPNLISHEEVIQMRRGSQPIRQEFEYLILSHRTQNAVTLDEYRVDLVTKKQLSSESHNPALQPAGSAASTAEDLRRRSAEASGRNAAAPPLSEGFASKWVHFYPSNRSESVFRYLGQQHIENHDTFVIAFAQKPGQVRSPGELLFQGRSIPLYYQGIAWVDESDFRIVHLRTDLLGPLKDVPLQELTAEVDFAETKVAQTASSLWLPHKVIVTPKISGQVFEEEHLYSDYRIYQVESKIVLAP
ncbi:MAG: hypothetical protein WB711_02765 [Terriglobales bacterium]